MNKNIRWYSCKRDFGIAIMAIIISFFSIILIERGMHDAWPVTFAIGFISYLGSSLFICLKHFWAWTVILSIGITASILLGLEILHPSLTTDIAKYGFDAFLATIAGNYIIFAICFSVIGICIFHLRTKGD